MKTKITAFVLNELPENERLAFLAELEKDPSLQKEVEATRAFCNLLHSELGSATDSSTDPSTAHALTEEQHKAIFSAFANPKQRLPIQL